jgi:hypothetical protein
MTFLNIDPNLVFNRILFGFILKQFAVYNSEFIKILQKTLKIIQEF